MPHKLSHTPWVTETTNNVEMYQHMVASVTKKKLFGYMLTSIQLEHNYS